MGIHAESLLRFAGIRRLMLILVENRSGFCIFEWKLGDSLAKKREVAYNVFIYYCV